MEMIGSLPWYNTMKGQLHACSDHACYWITRARACCDVTCAFYNQSGSLPGTCRKINFRYLAYHEMSATINKCMIPRNFSKYT